MKHSFKVTGLGLQVDGVMIMPGSEVLISKAPPSHWVRFGEHGKAVSGRKKKKVVATPTATSDVEIKAVSGRKD